MTGGANVAPGSPSASGTRGSGPASTDSSRARSSTLRAIGPEIPSASHWFSDGHAGTRPAARPQPVPRRRTTPGCAGSRPCRSPPPAAPCRRPARTPLPRSTRPRCASGRPGCRVVPKIVLKVWLPAANSGTFVFPIGTAPARRIRSTTSSSRSGTLSASSGEPYVVSHPATSWVSLNAHGSPCSGPRSSYGVRSASLAPSRARSSSRLTIAFSSGFCSAMRARWRSISSEQEISRLLSAASISRAVESMVRSVMRLTSMAFLPLVRALQRPRTSERSPVDRVSPHAHRRRPNRDAGDDAEEDEAGTDGDALDEVRLGGDARGRGGAVKTWPATGAAAGDGTSGGAAAGSVPAQRLVDVAEELAGHPLRDRGQHPLADAADHPADDGVGVPGDAGRAVAAVGEAHVDRRADRPRRTGAVELHHQRRRLGEVRQHARAGVRALDRGHAGGDGHVVGVLPRRDQPLAAGDGRDQHGGVQQRVPGPRRRARAGRSLRRSS